MLVFDELKKNDAHLRVLAWGALAGMGILLFGLWYVQIISHKHFVENQQAQSFRTVRIPAIRGKVLDHEGRALAENQPNYNVSLYLEELRTQFKAEFTNLWRHFQPPLVSQPYAVKLFGWKVFEYSKKVPAYKMDKNRRRQIEELARYRVVSNLLQNLSANLQEPVGISYAQFVNHYTNQLALPLPVASISNYAQVARFLEQRNNPPGLDLEMQPLRYYPNRSNAAHIVGCLKFNNNSAEGEEAFFNFRLPDYQGLVGIEGFFDAELRGRAGVKSVLVNNLGYRQSENIWVPAEPGKNVILTINSELQQAAEEALQTAQVTKHPLRGAVVVMDPNSGDILAMVSAPSYDPNLFIPKISPEDWEHLLDENLKPQRNRASQENYHPGSIFKVVVALAALEAGLDPNEIITNTPNPSDPAHGHIVVGRKFPDTAPPGEYDFRRAFIRSSNMYFITNGLRCGIENIIRIAERLHLGERTGLPTFQDSPGNFPKLKRVRAGWSRADTANVCIGQGEVDVTPVQMAVMISAVANGGTVYYSRLVERIEPQDLTSGESVEVPYRKARVRDSLGVSGSTLQIIREAMLADVEDKKEGTGTSAAVEGFRVCGKTGTAQIKNEENVRTDLTTWFASYAPYEKPRYVVIVMVESGASGGGTCAPVAGKIYRKIKEMESRGKNNTLVQAQISQAVMPARR